MRHVLFVALVASAVAASGCTHSASRGDVEGGLIVPLGAGVEMAPDKGFLFPTPIGANPMPMYPAARIVDGLEEQIVCLEIVIDEGGAVSDSRQVFDPAGCPSAAHAGTVDFVAAARDAVARWEFLAGAVCTFPPGVPKTDDCSGEGVVVETVPVKLAYRFRFRVVDGQPVVETGRAQ